MLLVYSQMALEAARASAFESRSYSLQLSAWAQAHLQTTQNNSRPTYRRPENRVGVRKSSWAVQEEIGREATSGTLKPGYKKPCHWLTASSRGTDTIGCSKKPKELSSGLSSC